MIDQDVRDLLERMAAEEPFPLIDAEPLIRRAHRRAARNIVVATLGVAAAIAVLFAGAAAIRTAPIPTDDPSEELGVFAPVAGRIVFLNEGSDLGYARGVWAVDPNGPSDTTDGTSVAGDVVPTLVRLAVDDATPLGWSNDGTELLLMRTDGGRLFPRQYLSVLHADGSESKLNTDPMHFGGAAISPDGTRVVFAAWGDDLGLYIVDAHGGRPARLPIPAAHGIVAAPTFSPDGTRIVYADTGEIENHVWAMDVDGTDAREILADGEAWSGVAGSLQWSPAGNRIAIQIRATDPDGTNSIYTFAPDGSDLTQVASGAISPYWSPDGSRIAFTIICDERPEGCAGDAGGLAIADADGSNVRGFGFAASGPWHPGGTR